MLGEKFGLLTVVEILQVKGYLCKAQCECGVSREVKRNKLIEHQVNSCGSLECKKKLKEIRKIYRTGFGCKK